MLIEAIYLIFKEVYIEYKSYINNHPSSLQISFINSFEDLNLPQATISNENSIRIQKYLKYRMETYSINKILLSDPRSGGITR